MSENINEKILKELREIKEILEKQNKNVDWKLIVSILALTFAVINWLPNLGSVIGVGLIVVGVILKFLQGKFSVERKNLIHFLFLVLTVTGVTLLIVSVFDIEKIIKIPMNQK